MRARSGTPSDITTHSLGEIDFWVEGAILEKIHPVTHSMSRHPSQLIHPTIGAAACKDPGGYNESSWDM
jgi:hypothetical protein